MIASVGIGLAVDDTIHFLLRYRRELRPGRVPAAAARRALLGTGRAMVYSALGLAAGFAIFGFSQFRLNREFGLLTAFILVVALAADLYGLEIIEENVEDDENNVTRFVVLSRDEHMPKRTSPDEKVVTTFIFNVRNIPAALYKAMGGFATNGINMTKLESYQIGGKFVATQFYADIEGHPDDENV